MGPPCASRGPGQPLGAVLHHVALEHALVVVALELLVGQVDAAPGRDAGGVARTHPRGSGVLSSVGVGPRGPKKK